jgi:hypothetical protein
MSNWIIRCANPRCRHVCDDRDWILKPKENPTAIDIQLCTRDAHCPKCDCTSYYKAKLREIKQAGLSPSPVA